MVRRPSGRRLPASVVILTPASAYTNYEKEHGIVILNDWRLSSLRNVVAAFDEDLELSRNDLHGLLL